MEYSSFAGSLVSYNETRCQPAGDGNQISRVREAVYYLMCPLYSLTAILPQAKHPLVLVRAMRRKPKPIPKL